MSWLTGSAGSSAGGALRAPATDEILQLAQGEGAFWVSIQLGVAAEGFGKPFIRLANVRRTGWDRAEKTFDTKDEAVRYGRRVARARSSELVIHRKDGVVSERSSYGRL